MFFLLYFHTTLAKMKLTIIQSNSDIIAQSETSLPKIGFLMTSIAPANGFMYTYFRNSSGIRSTLQITGVTKKLICRSEQLTGSNSIEYA